MRVLSLIASSTEIIHSLGCGDKLIGRSHECDYPPSVVDLPYCTEPRFNVAGSSIEIDNRVKSILQEALSVYRIDEQKLIELSPDLIVTQSQCDVCAVSLSDVENAVSKMLDKNPQIVSLEPNQLSDIWDDIQKVALRKLDYLNSAMVLDDLRVPPANRLEKLQGDLDGFYSIRINKQYRIIFKFINGNAYEVDIVDYH